MNKKHALILITILLISTIACELSFGGSDGPSEEEITMELTRTSLQQTQTALAQPPEPQPDASPADDDEAPAPSDNEEEEENDDESSCFMSRWTGDETIPDGSVFDPGDTFVKSWTLRNAGECDWTTDARMVFEEGDRLGGPSSNKLDQVVEPGDAYTVEIPMEAPSSDGDYVGVWRMTAADGTKMGKYWVKITVGDSASPAAFAVTSVPLTMPNTTIDIVCPGNEVVEITAKITTNGEGVVSYEWDDSQGCAGCLKKSVNFDSAGTKSITHSMTVGAAGDYWAKIYIDLPNHQWFGPRNFTVVCNP